MNRTLYEIGAELEAVIDALEGEEFSEEQRQQALDLWFEGCAVEVERKIDDYCSVIANYDAFAEARKTEARKLMQMAERDERNAQLMKDAVKTFFERAGIQKMKTARFAPSVRANGGKLPLVMEEWVSQDPDKLPPMFRRSVPDTDAIRAALEEELDVPGCRIGERGSHFRIR